MFAPFENKYASFKFQEGILAITYHSGIRIDMETAILVTADRLQFQQGLQVPILCDLRGVLEINKAARLYFAHEGSVLIKAVAFLIASPVSSVLTEFYIRTSKPPVPSIAFKDETAAVSFLRTFL